VKKTLIIIITYNGMRWLPDVIASLEGGSIFDVWVRDNGSTDGSRGFLKSHPVVNFYTEGENIGFGQANNLGLEFAIIHGYDSVLLLNQDAKVTANQIKTMRSIAEGIEGYFILCPVQLNWSGNEANPNFQNIYAPGWKSAVSPFSVDFVNAAIWFIPIKTLSLIGGFNPLFFMYGEDDDWARRLANKGGRVLVVPTLRCRHDKSVQSLPQNTLEELMNRYQNEETSFFFLLHKSFFGWFLGFLIRSGIRILKPRYAKKFGINPQIRQLYLIFQKFKKNKTPMKRVRIDLEDSTPFLPLSSL